MVARAGLSAPLLGFVSRFRADCSPRLSCRLLPEAFVPTAPRGLRADCSPRPARPGARLRPGLATGTAWPAPGLATGTAWPVPAARGAARGRGWRPVPRGAGLCSPRRGTQSAGGDVLDELPPELLELADPALDHIADADDAAQNPVADDRHVAYAVLGHDRHHRFDLVVGAAGVHRARHDGGDGVVHDRSPHGGEATHDLTLGHDALDARPVPRNHEGADVEPRQRGDRIRDRRVPPDGGDRRSLVLQHRRDAHAAPLSPPPWRRASQSLCQPAPRRPVHPRLCPLRWQPNVPRGPGPDTRPGVPLPCRALPCLLTPWPRATDAPPWPAWRRASTPASTTPLPPPAAGAPAPPAARRRTRAMAARRALRCAAIPRPPLRRAGRPGPIGDQLRPPPGSARRRRGPRRPPRPRSAVAWPGSGPGGGRRRRAPSRPPAPSCAAGAMAPRAGGAGPRPPGSLAPRPAERRRTAGRLSQPPCGPADRGSARSRAGRRGPGGLRRVAAPPRPSPLRTAPRGARLPAGRRAGTPGRRRRGRPPGRRLPTRARFARRAPTAGRGRGDR